MIHVGAMHCGSRYVEDSLSRSRGKVGTEGRGIDFSLKICTSPACASSDVKDGNLQPSFASIAGIKSSRGYGGLKSIVGRFSVLQLVLIRPSTILEKRENMASVMPMRSSRVA